MQNVWQKVHVEDFEPSSYPVAFWDVFRKNGINIRTTISEMGPILLAQLLGLNETQEGILNIAFKVADDQGLLLIDIKDLRAMLNYVGAHAGNYVTHGNIAQQSIGSILRSLPRIRTTRWRPILSENQHLKSMTYSNKTKMVMGHQYFSI